MSCECMYLVEFWEERCTSLCINDNSLLKIINPLMLPLVLYLITVMSKEGRKESSCGGIARY